MYERLTSVSLAMRELDEPEFMELAAILHIKQELDLRRIRQDPDGVAREREAQAWMRRLLKYNELVREHRRAERDTATATTPGLDAQPQNCEQAEQLGYVSCQHVLDAMSERFGDNAALSRFLKRCPQIRTYKPGKNRKMVHAGDLIRQLASEADGVFEQLDREDIEARTNNLRMQRTKEDRK
jgi:hypothetical protein